MRNELNAYYLNLLKSRYLNAKKTKKSILLDEAEEFTKLSRKRIIKILNASEKSPLDNRKKGRPCKYDEIIPDLRKLHYFMGNICPKRMKAAIPIWLPYYKEHFGRIPFKLERLLKKASASTIARLLKKDRGLRGMCSTKTNKKMKVLIPLKKLDEKVTCAGTIQADLVVHCGGSLAGEFANTLTMTDVYSGWTENRAIWTKKAEAVRDAVRSIEEKLVFKMKHFDTDCGTEFLNYTLMNFLENRDVPVKMRRSRPYKKNDQAYVEQKNFTHVRKIFKYDRIDKEELIHLMNDIYQNYWNPLHNYFLPTYKMESKKRVGAKISKRYGEPKTPAQRIIDCKETPRHIKNSIGSRMAFIDPIILKKELNLKLAIFTEKINIYKYQEAA